MNKIILPYFGGLGDSLQFSTLPRRFSELGYDVYISSSAKYRNNEIRELVWDKNPFIKGVSGMEPNAGDACIQYRNDRLGFISNWESVHGLEPESKYPEIYYQPDNNKSIKNKILVDVTATSLKFDYRLLDLLALLKNRYAKNEIVVCLFSNGISFPVLLMEEYEMIYIESIYHYCDLIHSCGKFVCLFSGGNPLASALQKYGHIDVDCICATTPKMESAVHQDIYFFDNINYIWL